MSKNHSLQESLQSLTVKEHISDWQMKNYEELRYLIDFRFRFEWSDIKLCIRFFIYWFKKNWWPYKQSICFSSDNGCRCALNANCLDNTGKVFVKMCKSLNPTIIHKYESSTGRFNVLNIHIYLDGENHKVVARLYKNRLWHYEWS